VNFRQTYHVDGCLVLSAATTAATRLDRATAVVAGERLLTLDGRLRETPLVPEGDELAKTHGLGDEHRQQSVTHTVVYALTAIHDAKYEVGDVTDYLATV